MSALALPLVLLLGAAPARAGTQAAAPASSAEQAADVTVAFRPATGYVGEEVRCPVYLEGTGTKALRAISLQLRFPSKLMTFANVEQGFLLQSRGATVETKTTTEKDDTTTLVVTMAADGGLPEGLVLYVYFKVADSAPPGDEIPLKVVAEGTPARGGSETRTQVPVAADPLRVSPRKQEEEFEFACFFYMH